MRSALTGRLACFGRHFCVHNLVDALGAVWLQLQEWAQYYRDNGTPEDEISAWVNGCLAAPDAYPTVEAPHEAGAAADQGVFQQEQVPEAPEDAESQCWGLEVSGELCFRWSKFKVNQQMQKLCIPVCACRCTTLGFCSSEVDGLAC